MAINWTLLLLISSAALLLVKAELDLIPPWPNNTLPKGCYRLDSNVKCYRIFQEVLSNILDASKSCHRQNGRLAFPSDETTWRNIEKDILNSNKKINGFVWLGGRVPAGKTYLVNDDNQQEVLPDKHFWFNSDIGNPRNTDRCIFTTIVSGSWKWRLSDSCVTNANIYYMCEFTVQEKPLQTISTCNMDDLEINIQNANFHPSLSPDKTVEESTIVTIECWKGYQLSGKASATCIKSGWSHYPKCKPVCVLPEKSPHSSLIECENKTVYQSGEEVLFVCQDGYKSKSDYSKTHFSLKCNEEGTWTGNSEEDCVPANEYEIVEIDISTRIHQRVRLNCGLEKTSSGVVTWWFNDNQINSSGNYIVLQSGALIINNVTELDHGMYFCIRQDSGIHEISSVYYELTRNTFIAEGKIETTKVIREGHSVILECQGALFGKVKWTRSGHVIRHSRTHYVLPTGALFIQNVHFSDNGVYQCVRSHNGVNEGRVVITHKVEVRDANDC